MFVSLATKGWGMMFYTIISFLKSHSYIVHCSLFCSAVAHAEKTRTFFITVVGPEKSLPFLGPHTSSTNAQDILAFPEFS